MALAAIPAYADGSVLFLNANGSTNISSLQLRVIPGTTNQTSFRVVATGGNISSLAFFGFSPDLNLTVSPANRTSLPDGDYQLVTVGVSVANNTQAGVKVASIFTLTTKPEQLVLPLVVEVPSTTEWNVTPDIVAIAASVNAFGAFNITLTNTGNIPITGHVSRIDLARLVFFDDSDFTLLPGQPLVRPAYYFVPNITPGAYQVNLTFVDALQNTRRVTINITLPDITAPRANISLDRDEYFPNQKIGVIIRASDDVNVSAVQYRLDTGNTSIASRNADGFYEVIFDNPGVGQHDLVVLANDSAGNLGTYNRTFTVHPFDLVNASANINLLKFMPGQMRSVVLLRALQPTEVAITLTSIMLANPANNTVSLAVNGMPLILGEPMNISVTGDVILDVIGIERTQFSGTIAVETMPDIANPAPVISFRGEIANYSVTPAFNVSIPGFTALEICEPIVGATYEESKLRCTTDFLIDTPQDQVGVAGSVSSLNAEREGNRIRLDACEADRSLKGSVILAFWFIVVIVIAAWLFKTYYWDQQARVPGLKMPSPGR